MPSHSEAFVKRQPKHRCRSELTEKFKVSGEIWQHAQPVFQADAEAQTVGCRHQPARIGDLITHRQREATVSGKSGCAGLLEFVGVIATSQRA